MVDACEDGCGYCVDCCECGITLSGVVTSYLDDTDDVTIQLFFEGGATAVYTITVKGMRATYSIEDIAPGIYTMVINKNNHVSRSYEIVVTDSNVVADAKICPIGDITGDGQVNLKDLQKMLRHINKLAPMTGYELACGDIVSGGGCNGKDYQRLLRHINKTNPLF